MDVWGNQRRPWWPLRVIIVSGIWLDRTTDSLKRNQNRQNESLSARSTWSDGLTLAEKNEKRSLEVETNDLQLA